MKVNSNLETVLNSDFIIVLGSLLDETHQELTSSVQKAMALNNAHVVYMHPIDDKKIKNMSSLYVKYEIGSEEGICALLIEYFTNNCQDEAKTFIENLDVGYLSAESSVGEEEFDEMVELSYKKKNKTLVVSRDLFSHEKIENISKLLGVLNKYSDFSIVFDALLQTKYQNYILDYKNEVLEEVDDIKAYDGTVIYKYGSSEFNLLIGGASFARVAKIKDEDEITIKIGNKHIRSAFKEDLNLQGTIALNLLSPSELSKSPWINEGYIYKRVNIERIIHQE